MADKTSDVRARLRSALEEGYEERVESFMDEALGANREVTVTCRNCAHRTPALVPDWSARTSALRLLFEQGYGRPKTEAAEEGGTTIILERIWPNSDDEIAELVEGEPLAKSHPLRHIQQALAEGGWARHAVGGAV